MGRDTLRGSPLVDVPYLRGCLLTLKHPYITDLFGRLRRRGPFRKRELALFVIGLSAAYLFGIRWNHGMADFAVNYRAGERILRGETLYQTADGHYMFKYFPSAALIYAPFAALPIELAMVVWFLLSLAAFIAVFRIVNRLVPQKRIAYPLAIAGVILAKYILHELRLGQINVFVTLLILASLEALLDSGWRAELLSGALAGVAVAIKPYAALFVLYLIVTLRWRSVAAALSALALCLMLPSAFYGVAGNLGELREWASSLSGTTPSLLTNVDNVSVLAFFTKWLGDPARAVAPTIVVLAILAVLTMTIIVAGWGRPDGCVLEGALILTLITLISPLGWDYNFMMALLAVTMIVNRRSAFAYPLQWFLAANFAVVAFALYDTMGRAAYGAFMRWSVTTINFGIVILALAYLRFRKVY